jgi:multicomponent Na+:H+ antiporter subunit D
MPITTVCCIVGAASISAFPLFSGFVSKAIIMGEMLHHGHTIGWLMLLFAAAGVFHHAGIKIPFFAFFGHDSGIKVKEAPISMLIAMSIAAICCIVIGVQPQLLYQLLPYEMEYSPYDLTHVVTQLQLLFFSALAFVYLNLKGYYPPELRSTHLDSDWLTRKAFPRIYSSVQHGVVSIRHKIAHLLLTLAKNQVKSFKKMSGPYGILARGWGANNMIFIVVLLLGALLLFRF